MCRTLFLFLLTWIGKVENLNTFLEINSEALGGDLELTASVREIFLTSATISVLHVEAEAISTNLQFNVFTQFKAGEKSIVNLKVSNDVLKECAQFRSDESFAHLELSANTTNIENNANMCKIFMRFWELEIGHIIYASASCLQSSLLSVVNSLGTFLIVLDDVIEEEEILNILTLYWKHSGALKVFILVCRKIYSFDPFAINLANTSRKYGELIKYSTKPKEETFKDLNGYQLNLEMFSSSYSNKYPSMKGNHLSEFFGPDAEMARFLETYMNFTCNWNMEMYFEFFF